MPIFLWDIASLFVQLELSVKHFDEIWFSTETNNFIDHLATFENTERWNTHDSILASYWTVLIHVDLPDRDSTNIFVG